MAVVSGNQLFTFGTAHLANAAPSGIWVLARGGEAVPVTQNNALNTSPVWSTDGASLLFVSSQDGARDLYQVNVTRTGRATAHQVAKGLFGAFIVRAKDDPLASSQSADGLPEPR